MRKNLVATALAACALTGIGMVAAGDDYTIDPVHSGVSFQISHLDLSFVHGRFNQFSGEITLDPADPTKSSFKMTIKPESVDTNNAGRDNHLRSPDFFNTKQYPTMEFVSTSVVPASNGGYEVTGNLTFHGETKPISFILKGGRTAEFKGQKRTGFYTEFKIKRSDFGITKFQGMLGDDVFVDVGFEAFKK
jgi:polyisoprenoid-binding protein YceI